MDEDLQALVDKRIADGEFIVVSVGQPSLKDQNGIGQDLTMVNIEMEEFGHTLISNPVLDNHDPDKECGEVLGIFFSDEDHHLMCVSALHGKTQASRDLIAKIRSGSYKECSLGTEYKYGEFVYNEEMAIPYKSGIFLGEMSFCEAGAIDGSRIVSTTASKTGKPGTTDPHGTRIVRAMEVDMMTKDGKHLRKSGKFVGPWHIADQLDIRKQEMSTADSAATPVDYKALFEKQAAELKAAEAARDAAQKVLADEKHAQRVKLVQESAVPKLEAAKKALASKGKTDTGLYAKYVALDEKALVEKLEGSEEKFARFMEQVDTIAAMAADEEAMEVESTGVEKAESSAVAPEGAVASKLPMDKAAKQYRDIRGANETAIAEKLKNDVIAALEAQKAEKRAKKLAKQSEVDKLLNDSKKGASNVKPYDWTGTNNSKKRAGEERQMDNNKKIKGENLPAASAASKNPSEDREFRTNSLFSLAHVVHHARENTGARLPTSAIASRSTPKKETEFDAESLRVNTPAFDKAVDSEVKRLNTYHTGVPVSRLLTASESAGLIRLRNRPLHDTTVEFHPFREVSTADQLEQRQY